MRPIPFLRPTVQLRHRHHLDSTTGQWIGILATGSCLLILMTDCESLAVRPGFFVDVSSLLPLFSAVMYRLALKDTHYYGQFHFNSGK